MTNVLVIAAHPDDEVLGCGGIIARHSDVGDNVQVVIVAEGVKARGSNLDPTDVTRDVKSLEIAAQKASEILGADGVEMLGLPDNRLDSIDRLHLAQLIEERVARYGPETVYVHHKGDLNIDHRRVHEAVAVACRPMPGNCVKRLLSFEVASSTEWHTPGGSSCFEPNVFVDISAQLERKIQALNIYSLEMRPWPHARSVKGVEFLARWRGATVGVPAAEAFVLLRETM